MLGAACACLYGTETERLLANASQPFSRGLRCPTRSSQAAVRLSQRATAPLSCTPDSSASEKLCVRCWPWPAIYLDTAQHASAGLGPAEGYEAYRAFSNRRDTCAGLRVLGKHGCIGLVPFATNFSFKVSWRCSALQVAVAFCFLCRLVCLAHCVCSPLSCGLCCICVCLVLRFWT